MSKMESRESTRASETATQKTIALTPAAIDWVKRIGARKRRTARPFASA